MRAGLLGPDDNMEVLPTGNLTPTAAAGLEQLEIETFGLKGYGGVLDNGINSVANPSRSMIYTYTMATQAGALALQANDFKALVTTFGLVEVTNDLSRWDPSPWPQANGLSGQPQM